jgi:replicative DNA helicase
MPPPPASSRSLPSNLEAERSVLGAILVSNVVLAEVSELLQPRHFYRDAHVAIYAAMLALAARQQAIDYVTVNDALARAGQLDKVGGPAYVAGLGDGVPRAVNAPFYARIVHEKAGLRDIIHTANRALDEAYADEQPPEAIARAAELSLHLATSERHVGELVSQRVAVPRLLADLERRVSSKGALSGISSGFVVIDEYTNGWQRGDLILIAARPSMGKTAIALNMALAAARAGHKVAFFSLEMTQLQLEYRLLSSLSGVMLFKVLHGWLGPADYARLTDAMGELEGLSLAIDDTSGLTMPEIRSKCRRMQLQEGLDLVFVDYLQLVSQGPARGRRETTRAEDVADVSRQLKALGKELAVPVVALSQLRRLDESSGPGGTKRPKLSDLKESGALEQDSDVVGMIHRVSHKESGPAEFLIEKQRNGPTGDLELYFDKEVVTFGPARVDAHRVPAAEAEPPPPADAEGEAQDGLPGLEAASARRHVRPRRRKVSVSLSAAPDAFDG